MPRRATGLGYETGREFGKELNGKRGLVTKVLHLVCEYHSPNRDRTGNRSERINLIF